MEDTQIIALYQQRDETAVTQTAEKYGNYCAAIAGNILENPQDVEEVLSDTWFRAWSTIPPEQPRYLKLYLARIARNLSYDRFRCNCRQKRGGGELELALEELSGCIPARGQPSDALDEQEVREAVNCFLGTLPERERRVFLLRYFRVEDSKTIAQKCGIRHSAVRTMLSRTRKKLKEFLQKEELYYE